jgi:alginate O-acetyltransferase complex protein AlgI
VFQTAWFLVAIGLGPLVYRRFSPELRPWLLVVLSILVVASADVTALAVIGLGCLTWVLPMPGVVALLSLRPLALWGLGSGGPLGASYVAFRAAHVAIDRKRGSLEKPRFAHFLAWLTFFPIWSAGPIERLDHWLPGLAGPQPGDLLAGWQRVAIAHQTLAMS